MSKNTTKKTKLLRFITLSVVLCCTSSLHSQELITFASWKKRCLSVPSNRSLRGRMPTKAQLPVKDFGVVDAQARRLLEEFKTGDLAEPSNWIGANPESGFFDIDRSYYTRPPIPFQPFTQKVNIPAGSKVIFHGDLHGDIRSLVTSLVWLNENGYMEGFKLKGADTYFVFLGDYVDRGSYGVEVLYTLMRLKLENPKQVLMSRGNHEDFKMTATYGFVREGQMKYGRAFNPLALWRVYDFLPVVLYLGVGNDYLQCNHGGMEPGYDPKALLAEEGDVRYELLGELKQKKFAKDNPGWLGNASRDTKHMANEKLADFRPLSPVEPNPIGFMWNDYFVFDDDPVLGFNASRLAFNHGEASTKYLMKAASSDSAKLRAAFRAHQHSSVPSPAMNRIVASNGVLRHWQAADSLKNAGDTMERLRQLLEQSPERSIPEGSVWTFNVSPDSVYGQGNDYSFDTIGILSTAETFKDWRLKVVNVPVSIK